ncbi:MobA-like NTP transferase domain-containing protein [Brevinema andersonii]|uniref:MobA-like NTP transferase domain-containing protein n=1 Tax=Brevinema andersonii TaxID=34097 RepID=A0A1I1D3L9_BREAD|nr:glycosyltransferase family 2 protein [Brevinema andersonii]SFB68926.1 MobA-like NTP transferase domain-containing protein [Brevinema andersonii]
MNIIIPMSGLGSRFAAAGYKDIKPLIKIHGKPIIEWVVRMFDPKDKFIFICRDAHLNTIKEMRETLEKIAPNAEIIAIEGEKKGPVWAVSQIFHKIDDNSPAIVSYCDYFQVWNCQSFYQWTADTNCDGSVVCYQGFHPHLIPLQNVYASCLCEGNKILEIREKFSFTENKSLTPQSSGMYYFKKGAYIKKYFQQLINENINLNGEYYVSLVYNLMIRDKLDIRVYHDVPYFCQWDTPEDLADYLRWAEIFSGEDNG